MAQIHYKWLPSGFEIDNCEHYLVISYKDEKGREILKQPFGCGMTEEKLKEEIGKLEKIIKVK
jgi:hypothetical protein